MRYICTGEEMQAIDSYSIKTLGIPGIVLMEKAAMSMEEEILSRFPLPASVLILAEGGNNGGDGLALGRLLMARGYQVTICEIGGVKKPSESYMTQKYILTKLGARMIQDLPEEDFDLYVDAVFGVGLRRDVSGIQADLIGRVNERKGFKLAVDVPSGVEAGSGRILGCCFKADLTITFGLLKAGLVLYPGADYAGEVVVKDIGFPDQAVRHVSPGALCFDQEDLCLLPVRTAWSNKGTYGRVLLIAGSRNMAGAAYLSALAAYRSGSGLVRIFTCEENREILQTLLPEAILTTWRNDGEALALLPEALSWATVIGIGPGTGRNSTGRSLLMKVLEAGRAPLVIDADGLNNLADLLHEKKGSRDEVQKLYDSYEGGIILTPHLKEMERLCGEPVSVIRQDLRAIAGAHADQGHVLVLKDARTIVSDGCLPVYINTSGNHGMSVAGSGDVLTGIICGFLAGGLPLLRAARLGVFCHGLAGDHAARAGGYYGLMARDIADHLSDVIG